MMLMLLPLSLVHVDFYVMLIYILLMCFRLMQNRRYDLALDFVLPQNDPGTLVVLPDDENVIEHFQIYVFAVY